MKSLAGMRKEYSRLSDKMKSAERARNVASVKHIGARHIENSICAEYYQKSVLGLNTDKIEKKLESAQKDSHAAWIDLDNASYDWNLFRKSLSRIEAEIKQKEKEEK